MDGTPRQTSRFVQSSSGGASGGGGVGSSKCEMGFLQLDPSALRAKRSVEFGSEATGNRPMPGLEGLRVSVVYSAVEAGDAWLLNATFPTVIENFPEALEVVVVVGDEAAGRVYRQVLAGFESVTPFDVRVVVAADRPAAAGDGGGAGGGKVDGWSGGFSGTTTMTPEGSTVVGSGSGSGGGGGRRNEMKLRFPMLWADQHCAGSHVLHLDPNSVLLKRVTYDQVFHFGKPVIPFTRFADEGKIVT